MIGEGHLKASGLFAKVLSSDSDGVLNFMTLFPKKPSPPNPRDFKQAIINDNSWQ